MTATKEKKSHLPTEPAELEGVNELAAVDGVAPDAMAARLKLGDKAERERLQEIVGAMRAKRRTVLSRRAVLPESFERAFRAVNAKFATFPRGTP